MSSNRGSVGGATAAFACLAAAVAIAFSHPASFRGGISDDVLHAISGALGSAVSITLLYPLETVRTRLQVSSTSPTTKNNNARSHRRWRRSSLVLVYDIYKSEGMGGLYKGWYSLVVALMALNFVYFYGFRATRRWMAEHVFEGEWMVGWMRSSGGWNKALVDLTSGYVAGCAAVLATGPLWLVNTRLKLQGVDIGQSSSGNDKKSPPTKGSNKQYDGILHCLYTISKEEGVRTLWRGTFSSIILACNPAIQLGVYETLKRNHLLVGSGGGGGGSLEHFANALVAKFVATIVTYPIQVMQTRHRAGISMTKESGEQQSWSAVLSQWYRGLESKLWQTCLNSAIMFVTYERLVGTLSALFSNGPDEGRR